MTDRLRWWEEVPLGLAATAQSVIVGQWYYRSIDMGFWWLNIAVALIAGLALDAIVVVTVMGRRIGRNSRWSDAAAFSAFLCSALIAVDTYSDWLAVVRPLLHVSYPLMVLLTAQHLATAKTALEPLPERSRLPEAADQPPDAAGPDQAVLVAPALSPSQNGYKPASAPLTLVEAPSAYTCPHCNRPLKSKQALGAAVSNGYCTQCKAERRAA
jgi:hypothetical protein